MPPDPEARVKVMSYNLRYGDESLDQEDSRQVNLLASIHHHRPDLLGVQEANEPWMEILPRELKDYAYVGVGRDDGVAAGERSAIFYLADKFEVIETGTFWLSETPEEPSFGWGATNRRVCTWAYLRNRFTGTVTAHFNTHLDHEVHEARVKGMAIILDRIAQSPHPVILTGDFNIIEGSELYETVEATKLSDTKHSAAESRPYSTMNWFIPDEETAWVIDYVFAEEGRFDVLRYEVDHTWRYDGKPVSDHYPVLAELALVN